MLIKDVPWDKAPEWRSKIDAPPSEPPKANPFFAIPNNVFASKEETNLSVTNRPHFSGAQPGQITNTFTSTNQIKNKNHIK